MESLEHIQKHIKGILSLESAVAKPSAAVCLTIQNMRDLIELQSHIKSEWRKNTTETGGQYRFNSASELPSKKPNFRGGAQVPRSPAPETPIGHTPPPIPKYQSKFKNSTQPVDDKILNNIILSKLNKFRRSCF
jgi:hypothetical protein